LFAPVVLSKSAAKPIAVLESPSVLFWSANVPVAVLLSPVVFC